MKAYGLIGFPLTHSFSKKYFGEKFKRGNITGVEYHLFPLASIDKLSNLINPLSNLAGFNVTIPYKQAIIPFLSSMDEEAKLIGAVNCVKIENGKLHGFNTDAFGFEKSLLPFLGGHQEGKPFPEQAFVLGTGGSAKAVAHVLNKINIPFHVISRQRNRDYISYKEIEALLKPSNLFINTTPLGLYPEIAQAPAIPYSKLGHGDFLFDLIYNPAETLFLQKGKAHGAHTKNGLEMLTLQAEKSWEIWNS